MNRRYGWHFREFLFQCSEHLSEIDSGNWHIGYFSLVFFCHHLNHVFLDHWWLQLLRHYLFSAGIPIIIFFESNEMFLIWDNFNTTHGLPCSYRQYLLEKCCHHIIDSFLILVFREGLPGNTGQNELKFEKHNAWIAGIFPFVLGWSIVCVKIN